MFEKFKSRYTQPERIRIGEQVYEGESLAINTEILPRMMSELEWLRRGLDFVNGINDGDYEQTIKYLGLAESAFSRGGEMSYGLWQRVKVAIDLAGESI